MSAKDSWAAIMCASGQEYSILVDCRRFGLSPFLPEFRRRWLPRGATHPMVRAFPLFPRYIFLPVEEARVRELNFVRGLPPRYLLSDSEGRLWTCPAEAIFEVARHEAEGLFDETAPSPGDRVRLKTASAMSSVDLFIERANAQVATLFSPLLGGSRVTAPLANLTRAG